MSKLPKVLITNTVPAEILSPLVGLAEVVMGPDDGTLMPRTSVLEWGPRIQAIVNQAELKVDRDLLDHCPHLKLVANVSIGINNLDLGLLRERKIHASNAPSFFAYPVAEHVLAGLLVISRRLLECDQYIRKGHWDGFHPGLWDGHSLHGRTLGIIGYGSIGRHLSRLAEGLGMYVVYHDRSQSAEAGWMELDNLLQSSHIVSLHVPLNEATRGLVDEGFLSRMRKRSILVNTSRGAIMKEQAVVEALQSGHLAGAVLDVFENEPQVSRELVEMHNVLLTPHVAGGTEESRRKARLLAVQNVAAVLKGKDPLTPVT